MNESHRTMNESEEKSSVLCEDKKSIVIDGKEIASIIESELLQRIQDLKKLDWVPSLAVIVASDRHDTQTYIRMKQQKAEKLGIIFNLYKFDNTVTEIELITLINSLNSTNGIHGIIVQLPLPEHINKNNVTSKISLEKDVDGFHETNMGKLALAGYNPNFIPCTPRGVWKMMKMNNIDVKGKHVVILGKSNIVGLPMAMLMIKKDATVTVCNVDTPEDMEIELVKKADILISAVGKAFLVKEHWIKEGAIVIDIGINSVQDKKYKSGYKLVGDVDFENVKKHTKMITPVPGGVGPLTVIMLMKATIESCEKHFASFHFPYTQ